MFDHSLKKFRLGLVYLFAFLAMVGIAPFVVLRYMNGEFTHALLDLAIVLVAVGIALDSYIRGYVASFSLHLAAAFYTLGAIAVVYMNSPIFVFWVFPAILSNFFLLRPTSAVVVNIACIGMVIPIALHLSHTLDTFAMLSSLIIGSTMAFLFAQLTEQQRKKLEIVAAQDPLTHLGNRRAMDEELRLCTEDHMRYKTPASLIVCDLDMFKSVNDRFGHNAGDEILVKIGQLLLNRLRKTDRAFRFGGEEFVLLARNTSLADAAIIAEQMREQIAREIIGPEGKITASFGCASIRAQEDREQWFIRADRAMYDAKARGRNCVALDQQDLSQTYAHQTTAPAGH
jgi:diguanylate cyclase (GGDEF)-like protein